MPAEKPWYRAQPLQSGPDGYPVIIWIDDQCDLCLTKGKGILGICFGYQDDVICFNCVREGLEQLRRAKLQ